MTNEERRAALNEARRKALENAEVAQGAADGSWGTFSQDYVTAHAQLAQTWAAVANAMKDGDPVHDGPDGRPTLPELREALRAGTGASKFTEPTPRTGVTTRDL